MRRLLTLYSCAVAPEELIESMHRCESNCNSCCIYFNIIYILNSSSSHLVNVSNLNQQLQLHQKFKKKKKNGHIKK